MRTFILVVLGLVIACKFFRLFDDDLKDADAMSILFTILVLGMPFIYILTN